MNASLNYNVALVPFDSIEIHFGAIGLCPPGLGKKRYDEMARALFVALQNGLLTLDDRKAHTLAMIEHDTRDGYRLLWNVLHLTLTAFDLTRRIDFSLWHDENQYVYQFAKVCILYFRLQLASKDYMP